ncbi:carbohydrate-binding cytochrome b562, partial [Colletotrichum graminicola M1.001]
MPDLSAATAQEQTMYYDKFGRCFASYTNDGGITFGIAIPEGATSGTSYDTIFQITAPVGAAWTGLAWGGSMTNNPLTIVWVNGGDVVVSSRVAFGYSTPPPYADAVYTVLPGTVVNTTHYSVTALCKGCTYWAPNGNSPKSLDPNGENHLAFAYSGVPVHEPANNQTTFSRHQHVGRWMHNFKPAQSAGFKSWAEGDTGNEP